MKRYSKKQGFLIALLFFVAVMDRITKYLALFFLNQGSVILNDSFFSFIRLVSPYALVVAGILFFVCLGWVIGAYMVRGISNIPLLYILLGMGSNLTDRIIYGGVIDWIRLRGISVFNIADVCIIVGVFFLFVDLFSEERNI